MSEAKFEKLRESMVREQLEERGITDRRVLKVMQKVPRHLFLPESLRDSAYEDRPLPLGPQQTISQPYIVALMLQELKIDPKNKVLDIGTGSGYQTALLAELASSVYSIDIDEGLLKQAKSTLKKLGYDNVHTMCADGSEGWKDAAPFDAIIVSAATTSIPRSLVKQLSDDGRLVLPLGDDDQELIVLKKSAAGLESKELGSVRFVHMKEGG